MTYKALLEMAALEPELSIDDACQLLAALDRRAFRHRVRSTRTGEWLFVFRSVWCGEPVYIKLLLLIECTIVSFHPEAPDDEVEDSTNAPGRGSP